MIGKRATDYLEAVTVDDDRAGEIGLPLFVPAYVIAYSMYFPYVSPVPSSISHAGRLAGPRQKY